VVDELNALERTIRQQQNRYYGKYRAFVADNADPETLGRCKLTIPSVLGETESVWALPAAVYGGAAGIGIIAVPPVGAQVLAEFLEGDISSPMWTGCFWRGSAPPPEAFTANPEPSAKVAATEAGHVLVFEDKAGEEAVTLTSAAGAVLQMNPGGSFALTDSAGATVTLDAEAGQIVIEDANGNSITLASSGITATDASGNEIAISASGITVSGATIKIEGQSVAIGGAGGEPLIKGQTFMAMFNAHTHNCTGPGAPSGPPLVPLTPAAMTIKTTAS
jgi:uncharacterized protein involved in type VI secretion and phage assembly